VAFAYVALPAGREQQVAGIPQHYQTALLTTNFGNRKNESMAPWPT
jgi:hypothetical protein